VQELTHELVNNREPLKRDIFRSLNLVIEKLPNHPNKKAVLDFLLSYHQEQAPYYSKNLYNEGPKSTLKVHGVPAIYNADAVTLNGYEILNHYFDELFATWILEIIFFANTVFNWFSSSCFTSLISLFLYNLISTA
jgi:hypothetical protein